EVFTGSKALRCAQKQLRRLAKAVSRKEKGSHNRHKAKRKLARRHARVRNIRSNDLYQASTSITRRFHTIGIEDLNVKGMLGNRCLSRAIADMGFGEFRRQLEYKAGRHGGQVVVVDRWYPSSKICSCCGVKIERLTLAQRHWTCDACGVAHDRDVNAAINLRNMAVSSTVSACGGEGAGPVRERRVKPAPVKQEFNSKASFK
uniref:RNA-guided endonuclease InsQ/TnpB family protein n=1 Tax=uncultured Massilia sp. TaxID=169973 RepID=UPI00258AC0D2